MDNFITINQAKEKKICTCSCHYVNRDVMHCIPCCDLTYLKYISNVTYLKYISNDQVNLDTYNKLKNKIKG